MRVRYARARGNTPATTRLLELAAEALLHLGERPEAEGASDEERLLEALERATGEATEAGETAQELLRRLRREGWIESEGERGALRLRAHPELLGVAELRALRALGMPPERVRGGAWPRPGADGPHEPHGPARPWRWGEPLRLDAAETLKPWLARGELRLEDLRVREGEGGRRLAVALLLDCSHSMVLYGADRFGPAKRLAMALHHKLRLQGDLLQVVCFHDVAEPVPPQRAPFLRAQPSHTHTAAALEAARAWLRRQGDAQKRAVLITDGHPTAARREDGRIYKNAWGRDPEIERATLAAAARLRRAGGELDVYLLADDAAARGFARELARAARGRVFEVDPERLGKAVLTELGRVRG